MRSFLPFVGTTGLLVATVLSLKAAFETQRGRAADFDTAPDSLSTVFLSTPEVVIPTTVSMPRLRPEIYYQAVTDRPLFSPSRRPLVPFQDIEETVVPIEKPVDVSSSLPELALLGILGASTNPLALLEIHDRPTEWHQVGDEFDGWSLSQIGPDWVEFSDGNSKIRLEMFQ